MENNDKSPWQTLDIAKVRDKIKQNEAKRNRQEQQKLARAQVNGGKQNNQAGAKRGRKSYTGPSAEQGETEEQAAQVKLKKQASNPHRIEKRRERMLVRAKQLEEQAIKLMTEARRTAIRYQFLAELKDKKATGVDDEGLKEARRIASGKHSFDVDKVEETARREEQNKKRRREANGQPLDAEVSEVVEHTDEANDHDTQMASGDVELKVNSPAGKAGASGNVEKGDAAKESDDVVGGGHDDNQENGANTREAGEVEETKETKGKKEAKKDVKTHKGEMAKKSESETREEVQENAASAGEVVARRPKKQKRKNRKKSQNEDTSAVPIKENEKDGDGGDGDGVGGDGINGNDNGISGGDLAKQEPKADQKRKRDREVSGTAETTTGEFKERTRKRKRRGKSTDAKDTPETGTEPETGIGTGIGPESVPSKEKKEDSAPDAGSEQWLVQELGGGQQRQDKFLRLLGGAKTSKDPSAPDNPVATPVASLDDQDPAGKRGRSNITKVENDLKRQFDTGMRMKNARGSAKRGLGA